MMKMAMTEPRGRSRSVQNAPARWRIVNPERGDAGRRKPLARRHHAKILRKMRQNAYQLWITQ
jgi:hypothetical protein